MLGNIRKISKLGGNMTQYPVSLREIELLPKAIKKKYTKADIKQKQILLKSNS